MPAPRSQSTTWGKKHGGATRQSLHLPFASFHVDQETEAQHDQHGIAMKPRPEPFLIMVPAQFAFSLFMILFAPMPPMRVFHRPFQNHMGRETTPELFRIAALAPRETLFDYPAAA